MTNKQFNQGLKKLQNENPKTAVSSLVVQLVNMHDLKERARISSADCEIEDYDNLSRVYELGKCYLIVAESSEIDQFQVTKDFDSALKIATDFCAR
jgi:hypothetical protein